MRRAAAVLLALAGRVFAPAADPVLPHHTGSLKFAAIGDNGTGDAAEYEVARQMASRHGSFPFELVIMLGDNLYGRQQPRDFIAKFEQPFRPLLDVGVRFYASLGNHDDPSQRSYPLFNMGGARYYSYATHKVRFFALDSDLIDQPQRAWIEKALQESRDDWKICYFHHPLYSDGKTHGSQLDLRVVLEPLFVKYGVNVVFSGHDHVYERIHPQKGITYFVSGAGGQLRKGDVRASTLTAPSVSRPA